jgi:hypothetical protein
VFELYLCISWGIISNHSSVTIKDCGMISSLIVIWHACVCLSTTKFFRIDNITISKAVSTINIVPMFSHFEILDVWVKPIQIFSSAHFRNIPLSNLTALQIDIAFSAWKIILNRKVKTILHFITWIEKILLFDCPKLGF